MLAAVCLYFSYATSCKNEELEFSLPVVAKFEATIVSHGKKQKLFSYHKDYYVKLHIDENITPVARENQGAFLTSRKITFPGR